MPLIGIPSFIKSAGPGAPACTHYFVSVRPTMAGVPGELPGAAEDAESKQEAGAATGTVQMPTITTVTKRTPSVSTPKCGHLCLHLSIHPSFYSFVCWFVYRRQASVEGHHIQSWLASSVDALLTRRPVSSCHSLAHSTT